MRIKFRPVPLFGEFVLGAMGFILAWNGHVTEAVAVAGLIGVTMNKAIESEEKTDGAKK